MIKLKQQIIVAYVFGILSLVAGVFSHLALTDIAHGEPDVTLEWNVVRLGALVVLVFIGFTFARFRRVLRGLS